MDPMLGDGKGWGVVTVHAGMLVERSSIMLTSHGAHLECAVVVVKLALEGGCMHISTARTCFSVEDDLQDVRLT